MRLSEQQLEEIFEFLDILRDSGEVNMFGASRDVEVELLYTKAEARYGTSLWMQTFDGSSSVSERVKIAQTK